MDRHRLSARPASWTLTLLAASVFGALLAQAQETPLPSVPVAVTPDAVAKLLKKDEPPDYPPEAKLNYIQGSVQLRIRVAQDGQVAEAHVIQGHPFLAASALKAVRNWVYRPYHVGSHAVEFSTMLEFHFVLRPKVLTALPPTAEKDLREHVTPPEVEVPPADPPTDDHVRLRILVDSEGHAVDTQVIGGSAPSVREAKEEVSHWKFRPAKWGALPVPWYLEIDVPVPHLPV